MAQSERDRPDRDYSGYPYSLASGLEAGEGLINPDAHTGLAHPAGSDADRETQAALNQVLQADLGHGVARFHDDDTMGRDDDGDVTRGGDADHRQTHISPLSNTLLPANERQTEQDSLALADFDRTVHQRTGTSTTEEAQASGPASGSVTPRAGGIHTPTPSRQADGEDDINTNDNDEDPNSGSGSKPKRKATSRINMLARGGACEFCKRRKLKCSAEEPSCAQCRKMGKECVYSQVKQRSRVRVLEDRLAELEKRMTGAVSAAPGLVGKQAGGTSTGSGSGLGSERRESGIGGGRGKLIGNGNGSDNTRMSSQISLHHGQVSEQVGDNPYFANLLHTPESLGVAGHASVSVSASASDPDSTTNSPWASLAVMPSSTGDAQHNTHSSYGTDTSGTNQLRDVLHLQAHAQTHGHGHSQEALFDRTLFPQPDNLSIPALPHAYPGNTPFNLAPMSSIDPSLPASSTSPRAQNPAVRTHMMPDLTGIIEAAASPGATATFLRIEAGHAPWEGLSAEALGQVLVHTVMGSGAQGGKVECDASVGESLVSHLLHILLTRPPDALKPFIRSPSLFLARFTPSPTTAASTSSPSASSLPPHPCLLLAIVCSLLPISPSPTLRRPGVVSGIMSHLLPISASLAAEALSNGDTRVLDVICSQGIRTGMLYYIGRFLDGFKEGAGASGLAWAAGLGKMGGVGERMGWEMKEDRRLRGQAERRGSGYMPMLQASEGIAGAQVADEDKRRAEYMKRVELEKQFRVYRYKGAVVAPPANAIEYGERVQIFWELYCDDKAGALGWGWPCNFDEEEITTPLPVDDYENLLLNPEYISDIFHSPSATDTDIAKASTLHGHENEYKAWVRSLALCYRATRLFDQPSSIRSTAKALELKRAAEAYMQVFPRAAVQHSGEWGRLEGPKNEVWMMLHLTMSFIHGRLEIDSKLRPDAISGEAEEHLDRCIRSLFSVAEGIDLARESGDFDFEGYNIMSALSWQAAGRTAYKLAQRMEAEDAAADQSTAVLTEAELRARERRKRDCRSVGDKMVDAMRILGKRVPFSGLAAQLVQNVSFGNEVKVGEWVRPDYVS